MHDAKCPCGGRIIPYLDIRDGLCHCEICGRGFNIAEFWACFIVSEPKKKLQWDTFDTGKF